MRDGLYWYLLLIQEKAYIIETNSIYSSERINGDHCVLARFKSPDVIPNRTDIEYIAHYAMKKIMPDKSGCHFK